MESNKITLPVIGKTTFNTSSMNPLSPNYVHNEFTETRRNKDSTLRNSADLTKTLKHTHPARVLSYSEKHWDGTVNGGSYTNKPTHKPTERVPRGGGYRAEKYIRNSYVGLSHLRSVSKSPIRTMPSIRSRSPILGLMPLSESPKLPSESAQTSKTTIKPSSPAESPPNAREQLLDLVLESQKRNSLPISVEKKTVDGTVHYKPSKHHNEDYSGTTIFTKHGFFEISKDKNIPSRFMSKKDFAVGSVYRDIFKKLPFLKNFYSRKFLMKWRYVMRKNQFDRKREKLVNNLWMTRPIFMNSVVEANEYLGNISRIVGVEYRENSIYGKRYTDFNARQHIALVEASKELECSSVLLIKILLQTTEKLKKLQDKQAEEFEYKMIQEKMKGKKETGNKVNIEILHYQNNLKQDNNLLDGFVFYLMLGYQNSLLEVFANSYITAHKSISGHRRPKFELIMSITDSVSTEPNFDITLSSILNTIMDFEKNFAGHKEISNFHQAAIDSLHFSTDKLRTFYQYGKIYSVQYVKEVTHIRQDLSEYYTGFKDKVMSDFEAMSSYIFNFKHLEEIKRTGLNWLDMLTTKKSDVVEFYKENYKLFSVVFDKIEDIPALNVNFGIFIVETGSLRNKLLDIPKSILNVLKERLLEIVSKETAELKGELALQNQTLEERASNLPQFVEQMRSIKNIKDDKIKGWDARTVFIGECLNLCRKEGIRIPAIMNSSVDDCKNILKGLPKRIALTEEHYIEYKSHFTGQLLRGAAKLSRKINKFQTKYTSRYLQDPIKMIYSLNILKELDQREEALAAMKERVESYEEFNKALKVLETTAEVPELPCRKDFADIFTLHCDTLKLWKLINYWKKHYEEWSKTIFHKLNVKSMYTKINKVRLFLKTKNFDTHEFFGLGKTVIDSFMKEIDEIVSISDLVLELKSRELKPRHWELIYSIIRKPQFSSGNITLQDLKDRDIRQYSEPIAQIMQTAKQEYKFEEQLLTVRSVWDELNLQIVSYQDRLDAYIIQNAGEIQEIIEEHSILMTNIKQQEFSEHLHREIDDWKFKLALMNEVLELWIGNQQYWLQLEPLFISDAMRKNLPKEYESFKSHASDLKKATWSANNNPKACYNLLIPNRKEYFETILNGLSVLKKSMKEFIEWRKISFPRFFFLTDAQLMDYFSEVHSESYIDKYFHLLFPGAWKLYLRTDQRKTLPDASESLYEHFQIYSPGYQELTNPFDFNQEDSMIPGLKDILQPENQQEAEKNGNKVIDSYLPEIFGMIGANNELLVFDESVSVHGDIEVWLNNVEKHMKSSLEKMLKLAVTAFPNVTMDEWIMDFPLQVVISALHLILSHEIQEMLESGSALGQESTRDRTFMENMDEHFSRVFFDTAENAREVEHSKSKLLKYLQKKCYKGLYLRIQFWINQLIKSLRLQEKKDRHRTSLQIAVNTSMIHFLLNQRDFIATMMRKRIQETTAFEWINNLKIFWNDEGTMIEMGNLNMTLGSEFVGSAYRLFVTPQTDKCLIHLAESVAQSSYVVFEQNSEQVSGEIFSEFCNLLCVYSQQIVISTGCEISNLVRTLNGAAFAGCWMYLRDIHLLPIAHIDILCAELQTIRQQYTRQISDHQPTIKVSNNMYVSMLSYMTEYQDVKASIDKYRDQFRPLEILPPDIKHLSTKIFIREGLQYHRSLSDLLISLINIINETEKVHILSSKDIVNISMLTKVIVRQNTESSFDNEIQELISLAKATRFIYLLKVAHLTSESERYNQLLLRIDETINKILNKKTKGSLEVLQMYDTCEEMFKSSNYDPIPHMVKSLQDLYYGMRIHGAVMIVGPPLSGKSTLLNLFLKLLEENSNSLKVVRMNPSIIPTEYLNGFHEVQKKNSAGLLSKIFENMLENEEPIQMLWLESRKISETWVDMFSTLFDRSLLVSTESDSISHKDFERSMRYLPSSNDTFFNFTDFELGKLLHSVLIYYETQDMSNLSPSLIHRVMRIYLPNTISIQTLLNNFSNKINELYCMYGLTYNSCSLILKSKENLLEIVKNMYEIPDWKYHGFINTVLSMTDNIFSEVVSEQFKPIIKDHEIIGVTQDLLDKLIQESPVRRTKRSEINEIFSICLDIGIIWGIGAQLSTEHRSQFYAKVRENSKCLSETYASFCHGDFMHYMYNFQIQAFVEITTPDPTEINYRQIKRGIDVILPTKISRQLKYFCELVGIRDRSLQSICLIGNNSTGKISLSKVVHHELMPDYIIEILNYSNLSCKAYTKVIKKYSDNISSTISLSKPILFIIEDIHLDPSPYYPQTETIKEWVNNGMFLNTSLIDFSTLEEAGFISTSSSTTLEFRERDGYSYGFYVDSPEVNIYRELMTNGIFNLKNALPNLLNKDEDL